MPLHDITRDIATTHHDTSEPISRAAVPLATPYELPMTAPPQGPTTRVETPPPAAKAADAVDMDELVERACRAMLLRLTVEQERRGFTRWA
jgi:hypothetical protein